MTTTFHVDVAISGDRTVVTIRGELDVDTCPQVTEATSALALTGHTLVMDLTAMTFLDSSGLTHFIKLRRRAHTEGWTLELHGASEQVMKILDLTGTLELFTLHPLREPDSQVEGTAPTERTPARLLPTGETTPGEHPEPAGPEGGEKAPSVPR
ncbi:MULTISPECIES: STAS domain-containing protein [unclassified Streptomyces]|uniref:STAS domain-containing protein n=1 Tax=unclassified Streptomyces TaxID=2593676 RepID=UPI003658AD09